MKKSLLPPVKKMLLGLGICCCAGSIQAQNLSWAKHLTSDGYDAASATAVDASGNVYIAGRFSYITDFDPGTGVHNLTSSGSDAFLLKLNAAGGFEWVRQFEASNADVLSEPSDIVLDASGNIYISGNFGSFGTPGTVDFDPGPGTHTLNTSGDLYTTDVFVVKLDATGGFIWARQLGGDKSDASTGIALTGTGDVLVTGTFRGTADFNPGAAVANLTASSSVGDVFITKLNNGGDYVWAKRIGGTDQTIAKGIRTDVDGNIYTLGAFAGTADFDPGAGIENMTTAPGPYSWPTTNMFVSKLDPGGNYIWARKLGVPANIHSSSTMPFALAADAGGNTYITGSFSDTVDFDPGTGTANLVSTLTGANDADIFVCKLDSSGQLAWAKGMGSIYSDIGYGITTDESGNVYTIGVFGGPADFDPSDTGTYTMTPVSSSALFLSKLDSAGRFVWATNVSGAGVSIGINGEDIALSPLDNSIHIVSEFSGTADFDPGPGTFNLTAVSNNVFVLKLNNCSPITTALTIAACDSFRLNGTTYTQSGTYTQTFTNAAGCDSSVVLTLHLDALDRSVSLAGNVLGAAQAGATYQWINCNQQQPIAGATQQSYTALQNGSYAVVLTKGACRDTSVCLQVTGMSIKDVAEPGTLTLAPNPAKDKVTLFSNTPFHHAICRILDMPGREVLQQGNLNGTQLTFDISALLPGVYIVELQVAEQSYRTRLVKQ
ncbi:SBBP repeat-containing protein [Taibaiella koreensis]|uniref:SBBP repeat-containing protein n=1 Tax=Taibaiella koreensis TaxID=1268548 RepID=UPI000E59B34B|nr:SBBP repeat-containing protein [Taibaiella koreensis]